MIEISIDKKLLDLDFICGFLNDSYWASTRTREEVEKSIDNSICFGVYRDKKQIGFARVITDNVVFSYLLDVFIDPKEQGKKYGEELLKYIYNHRDLKNVNKHYLHTKDAQKFYTKLGFNEYPTPDKFMIKKD